MKTNARKIKAHRLSLASQHRSSPLFPSRPFHTIKPHAIDSDALKKKVARLNEWKRRLSILLRYGRQASVTTTLDELLALLVAEAKTVLNAERATVFIVDENKQELWSKVASEAAPIRIPINSGIAGTVATTGQMLNIPDVYKDPRFNPDVDKKTGYRTKSVLTVPMLNTRKKVIGVFQVLNRKPGGRFDPLDEEVLILLADQAAGDIENAQLYQQVRKGAQETIIRLAAAAEYKDHDTTTHLWRMSQYCAIIAKEMGFSPDWIENLRMAAPMHDIGKIGVPDAVLNKPGKLDEAEWVEMRKHPTFGYNILKDSDNDLMQMSAVIAFHHHEKWDGSGYPRGIKGPDIPMEARIATLADVFDALTSKRIYKNSMSVQDTLDLIKKESGRHFDPAVVDAFLACLPHIQNVMNTYPLAEESTSKQASPAG